MNHPRDEHADVDDRPNTAQTGEANSGASALLANGLRRLCKF